MAIQKGGSKALGQKMKALKEIGIRKAAKFILYSLAMGVFDFLLLPMARAWFLRFLGAQIGKDVIIHRVRFFNYYRTGFKGIKIGNYCFLGNDVLIDLADELHLEEHVTLSERVAILTHTNVGYKDHPLQRFYPPISKPVFLAKGSFVGINSVILPGVRIGEGGFVSACSLVNSDVAPYTVVAGNPAKKIKDLQ